MPAEATLEAALDASPDKDARQAAARKSAALNLRLLLWILAPLALMLVTSLVLMDWTARYGQEEMVVELSAIQRTALSLLDPAQIARLAQHPESPDSADFRALHDALQHVRDASSSVRYIYLLGLDRNDVVFLVDAEPEGSSSYSPPGSRLAPLDDPSVAGVRHALTTGELTVTDPYEDRWGRWVSSLLPVRGVDGRIIAVLGADVEAERWDRHVMHYHRIGMLLSALITLTVLLSTGLVILEKRSAHRLRAEVRRQHALEQRLRQLSQLDGLTGIANRRRFDETLQEEWLAAQEAGKSLGLLMLDVDHFKAYNDACGHLGGDTVLASIAHCLAHNLRAQDLVARYGGEEFALVLPGLDLRQTLACGERIRQAIRQLAIPHPASPSGIVTVSLGAASLAPETRTLAASSLLDAADRALYRAKSAGRDQIC